MRVKQPTHAGGRALEPAAEAARPLRRLVAPALRGLVKVRQGLGELEVAQCDVVLQAELTLHVRLHDKGAARSHEHHLLVREGGQVLDLRRLGVRQAVDLVDDASVAHGTRDLELGAHGSEAIPTLNLAHFEGAVHARYAAVVHAHRGWRQVLDRRLQGRKVLGPARLAALTQCCVELAVI